MSTYEERRRERLQKYGDKQAPTRQNTQSVDSAKVESYQQRRQQRLQQYSDPTVDVDYFNSFLTDASDYLNSAQSDWDRLGVGTSTDVYASRKKQADDLRKRSSAVRRFLENNRSAIDAGSYTTYMTFLDDFDKTNSQSIYEFYGADRTISKYNTEEEYQAALLEQRRRQEYGSKSYDELQRKLNIMDKSTEEYAWLKDFAPTVMTTADKKKVYDQNQAQITLLKAVLEEYEGLAKRVTGADSYAAIRRSEIYNQYGSPEDLEQKLDELQATNWKLGKEIAYGDVGSNADFAEKSGYVTTARDVKWWENIVDPYNPGFGDLLYEYINNQSGARNAIYKYFSSNFNKADDNNVMALQKFNEMKPEEVATYNYLYATQGPQGAGEYLNYLSYALNERQMQKLQGTAQEMSNGFWGGLGSSVLSVPMALVGGVGMLDAGFQKLVNDIHEAATGEYAGPVDYNTTAMGATVASTTIRNTVSKNIANATGTINMDTTKHPTLSRWLNGKSLGDVYQLGMSMVDSGTAALISSAIGPVGTVLLGGNAGTQGMLDAVANGATDEQAIWMGVLNGGFEMLFEKMSIDNLLKGGEKNIAKAFLKQGLVEGSEEAFTSIANTLADIVVMAEKSDWQKGIDKYLAQGLSQEEAEKEAFWDTCIQIAWDFTGGVITGGIMGSVGTAIENHNAKKTDSGNSQTNGNPPAVNTQPVQQQAQTADPVAGWDAQSQIERNWGRGVTTQNTAQKTATKPVQGLSLPTLEVGTQQQREQMQRLSQATGREVVLYEGDATENGYYTEGKIYVNVNGVDPAAQTFSHELTHSVESAEIYNELSSLVLSKIQNGGANIAKLRQEKVRQYAKHGENLAGANIDREIVADYVARNLLTDEQSILELTQEKPSLGHRIMEWIDRVLAKLGNANAQERAFLAQARALYAKALGQTQSSFNQQTAAVTQQVNGNASADFNSMSTQDMLDWVRKAYQNGDITEEQFDAILDDIMQQEDLDNTAEPAEVKHSYAGIEAETADRSLLQQAQQLWEEGVDEETIRQETGWFVGKDGKWRFEIDDSQMKLANNVSNYMRLGDLLQHDKLYEAYPDLADVDVIFESMQSGVYGKYNRQFDSISLNRNLWNDQEGIKNALVHEIQHAIQNREGFTAGATVEGWERKIRSGYDSRRQSDIQEARETEEKLEQIREAEPAFYQAMMELDAMTPTVPRGKVDWDTLEQIEEDPVEWQKFDDRRDAIQDEYGDLSVFDFFNLLDTRQRLAKVGRTAVELYYDTAGEIEARDVEYRRGLSEDERKKRPPRVGGDDVVFSDRSADQGYVMSYSEEARIKDQIRSHLDELNSLDIVGSIQDSGWRGLSTAQFKKKIVDDLRHTGYQVDRQNFGVIQFDKKLLERSVDYVQTDGESAAYRLLPKVLKRGIIIAGHEKHKGRQYDTVTIAAPVEINGKRGNMAVVVRFTKGNRYDVHRILTPDGGRYVLPEMENAESTSGNLTANNGSQGKPIDSASTNRIADVGDGVKRQFSFSDSVFKRNVVNDLKDILFRGGDPAELRQYVAQMEQNTSVAEQSSGNVDQITQEAEQILQSAKQQGVSVDEYLRWNWEQYEYDGGLNDAARKALELERGGSHKQYSISDEQSDTSPEGLKLPAVGEDGQTENVVEVRDNLPTKAKDYLKRAERRLLKDMSGILGAHRFADRSYLEQTVRQISDSYLMTGTISQENVDRFFTQAYNQGIAADTAFYEQYKEVKTYLRTTSVTLHERDHQDIADWPDFRKRTFGVLRLVNEGGLPVDSAYEELRTMAPELFPKSIAHPADQLMHMYDVARSITKSEKTLQEYYGVDAREFKKWAKRDFESAIGDVARELQAVKRVADEKAAAEAAEAAAAPTTPEEAMDAYSQLKQARRTYEKAMAKNILTEHDEIQVGRLLKGELLLEHLDRDVDNVKGITAVYEAKQEYERLTELLTKYRRNLRKKLREQADSHLETANEWKDKKVGILYSRETMTRNIQDIVKDPEVAKRVNREYFEPIAVAEAEATRFKNWYRDRVRALKLTTKPAKGDAVSEAHAVQLLGEVQDNIRVLENARGRLRQKDGKTLAEWRDVIRKLWEESPSLDKEKIEYAVKEFRYIYDQLFQKMNEARVRNGYEPVNYRKGYFPHFQPGDGDGVIAQFGKILGIDTQVAALPTTINGLTHTFKPGIQWFGNAQERLGFNTAYDAVEGFDKYIEGVSSVIYQTDNIQKLRALATQVRYRTSDEGIRKQVDAVNENTRLTEEEKQVQIASIYEHGKYTLSNFVVELDEYTNLLANKKSKLDRTMEGLMGRRAYTVMKAWESRVGANMIAGNLSSALTNIIPLTQAGAQLDRFSLLRGMWSALQSYRQDDGVVGKSAFLTNRRGSDPMVKNWAQKTSEVLGMPMELIDTFVSDSIVRGAYYQNLKRGLSDAEAMHQADLFAASVMADRSRGAMPTLFESTNPIFKAFTQFQLEVNNQFSEVFKDVPRRFKEKGIATLALVLLKYFLGAFLFDEIYEFFIGRRPALDPIDMLNHTVGDLTGYELPNLLELGVGMVTGDMPSFETEKAGVGKAVTNLTTATLEELPFSAGLGLLGIELDGGRIPISSAIPDIPTLWNAATNTDWSGEKRWKEAQDELNKLAYILPPFAGNQVSKIWKGLKAYFEGGSYNVDAEGNKILQYPVYKDDPQDAFWNLVRATIMGKNSLPEAQSWVDSGFDSMSAKQTAIYQDMLDAGVTDRAAYAILRTLQDAEKTEELSKTAVQRNIIRDADLPGEGKAILYYGIIASEKNREVMDELADMGADPGAVANLLMDIQDAENSVAIRTAISKSALTDEEKIAVYQQKVSDSRNDDIAAFDSVGLDFDKFVEVQNEYARINNIEIGAASKALEFSHWVECQDYTENQADVIKDCFKFYSQIPADAKRYEDMVDAGMNPNTAYDLAEDLSNLKPQAGAETVTDVQKWRASVDFSRNVSDQMMALSTVMSEAQFSKVKIANSFGVDPDSYVTLQEIKPQYDADGNGSYKNAEIQAAIDSMGDSYTDEQKAVLWQLATGSTSSRNNPYSRSVGQQVIDAREAAKTEQEMGTFEEEIVKQWTN